MSDFNTPPALESYRIVVRWPVQWGDQDAFGHVNNVVYFRWFETARIEYFDRVGLRSMIESDRIGPILASIKCDFRRQLTHPDGLRIGARVERIGRSSIQMVHAIWSEAQAAVVAEGDSTIVCFDYAAQKPCAVPDAIRAAIEQTEGRAF